MTVLVRYVLMLLAIALIASGCVTRIGEARVVFRVASRTPDRVVENVDGEHVVLEGADPEGRSLFLIVRGIW